MDYAETDARERHALHQAGYISLGTFRRDGRVVRTPVWFAESDGRFWVFSAADAGKVKRLHNDPRCNIARCDAWGGNLGPLIDACGERVTDPQEQARGYQALRSKYGWQMWLTDVLSRIAGRYHQRAMLKVSPRNGARFGG